MDKIKTLDTYCQNNMIKEDYVSFETAKLLNEKGFNGICRAGYSNYGSLSDIEVKEFLTNATCPDTYWECAAPSIQMAMKWLREAHNISVRPRYDEVDDGEQLCYVWFYDILQMKPYKELAEVKQGYDSYEEACEAAIKYCLENLI